MVRIAFDKEPDLSLRLLAVVCKRLRETSAQLEDTAFLETPSPSRAACCASVRASASR